MSEKLLLSIYITSLLILNQKLDKKRLNTLHMNSNNDKTFELSFTSFI